MDDALPELVFVCGRCCTERRVTEGVNPVDVAWLHERRCGESPSPSLPSPSPLSTATCPSCAAEVVVPPGLSPIEAIWLHEDDCPVASASSFAYA